MLLSVDPGVNEAGVAVWEDARLTSAWLAQGGGWLETARSIKARLYDSYPLSIIEGLELAIERPQVYTQNRLKGDPNDLIDLALMAGALVGMVEIEIGGITLYLPRQWKGQLPKDVTTERSQKKLSKDERAVIELPRSVGKQHNVWDAVGIGLRHLRRVRADQGATKSSAKRRSR
jgi:hypothetical protein